MLQVFHKQAWQGRAGKGGPHGCSSPRVRAGSAAAGAKHKATSMSGQQAQCTWLYSWASSRHRARDGVEHEAAFIGALRVQLLKMGGQQARVSGRALRLDVRALVSPFVIFGCYW
jgi:hypothetical protein